MKLTLVSNYLNIHQKPLCDAFVQSIGIDNFSFIACDPFNKARLSSGYTDMNSERYVIRAYEDAEKAKNEAIDADILISIPYASQDFVNLRLSAGNKITFSYSERLLKRGLWFRYFPPKRVKVDKAFSRYMHHDSFHVLCASAFTSYDLSLFGFPSNRCWKWGYFPNLPEISTSNKVPSSITWVGRLIQWKRPYEPLLMAKRLMHDGRDFHLTMIGNGKMRGELEGFIRKNGLSGSVTIAGSLPNLTVQQIMSKSDIFLFTSSRMEGWGAVLSEAMSNGCAPVASSLIGSVPYLIQDGVNGRVYSDGNEDALYQCVAEMIDDRNATWLMGQKARETMTSLWNPEHAARSLIELSECLLAGDVPTIADGPCSPAGIIKDTWYRGCRG